MAASLGSGVVQAAMTRCRLELEKYFESCNLCIANETFDESQKNNLQTEYRDFKHFALRLIKDGACTNMWEPRVPLSEREVEEMRDYLRNAKEFRDIQKALFASNLPSKKEEIPRPALTTSAEALNRGFRDGKLTKSDFIKRAFGGSSGGSAEEDVKKIMGNYGLVRQIVAHCHHGGYRGTGWVASALERAEKTVTAFANSTEIVTIEEIQDLANAFACARVFIDHFAGYAKMREGESNEWKAAASARGVRVSGPQLIHVSCFKEAAVYFPDDLEYAKSVQDVLADKDGCRTKEAAKFEAAKIGGYLQYDSSSNEYMTVAQAWETFIEPVLRSLNNRVTRIGESYGFEKGWQDALRDSPAMKQKTAAMGA